jgi:MFS transporter, FHS family, glucose/mannose:H+ symporter
MMAYSRRLVFASACLGMLVFGIMLTTLGAVLPSLIERFGLDKAAAGSLFTLMSLGILAGSLVFGPLADRYGFKALLVVSAGLILAGLQGLAFAPEFGWLRPAILLIGFGGGVINGGATALVADITDEGKTAGLSLLGVFFGIGAVGVPFSLAMLLGAFGYTTLVALLGLTLLLPMAFMLAIRFPPPKHAHGFPLARAAGLVREPLLLLLGLMLFLQSGMEITLGGWTATFFQEELGLAGDSSLLYLSLYWFGLMLARLALGTVLARVPPRPVLAASMLMSFTGALLLLGTGTLLPAAAGVFLLGAGFAAVFPVLFGIAGERYAALSGTAFGIMLVMALTGGSTLPLVTGVLGEGYGLRASLLIVPAALLVQAVLFVLVLRRLQAQPVAAGVTGAAAAAVADARAAGSTGTGNAADARLTDTTTS